MSDQHDYSVRIKLDDLELHLGAEGLQLLAEHYHRDGRKTEQQLAAGLRDRFNAAIREIESVLKARGAVKAKIDRAASRGVEIVEEPADDEDDPS